MGETSCLEDIRKPSCPSCICMPLTCLLTYFFYLFTSLIIGLFCFQAKEVTKLALVFLCLLCVVVYFVMAARLLLLW